MVRHPEVSSISSSLVGTNSSLTDITLSAIIGTEFVHGTDAPSLSLIVPVVHVMPPLSPGTYERQSAIREISTPAQRCCCPI